MDPLDAEAAVSTGFSGVPEKKCCTPVTEAGEICADETPSIDKSTTGMETATSIQSSTPTTALKA